MTRMSKLAAAAGVAVAGLMLGAAGRPYALRMTSAGMWEVSGAPGARGPVFQCVADPIALAQFEHRGKRCTRTVISDNLSSTVISYTCLDGGFGRSKITVLTPRALRIETQGISQGLPFNYVIQARRVGNCPGGPSAVGH